MTNTNTGKLYEKVYFTFECNQFAYPVGYRFKLPHNLLTYTNLYYVWKCRHVILPKELSEEVPRTFLMTESEWRNLGVQQSPGWIHFMIHNPGKMHCRFERIKDFRVHNVQSSLSSANQTAYFGWLKEQFRNNVVIIYFCFCRTSYTAVQTTPSDRRIGYAFTTYRS
jgi:cyclin-dependent kinase regulatory subunit CKS1